MRYLSYFLLIFSFPFGVLSRFSITPSVHIYLHDVFVVLIICLFFKEIARYFLKSKRNLLVVLIGLFAVSLFGIITHTHSLQEFISSFLYMVRLAAYVIIAIPLFVASGAILNKLKISLLTSGFLFVTFGYIQYIFYPNLRNLYYLGWDEHLSRMFTTLLDPNFSGIYIFLILLLYLSFMLQNFKRSGLFKKIFYFCGGIFLMVAFLLTYSRGAYITLFVALPVYLYLVKRGIMRIVFFVVLLLVILLLNQSSGGEGVNLLRTASIFARFEANTQGLLIFLQNPILGVGYNTLRFIQVEYGFVNGDNAFISNAAAGFPNSYVVILATTGILGFSISILILYKIWRWIRDKTKKQKSTFSYCVLASFIAVLVSSLFENTLFYGVIVLWMVLEIGILKGSTKD